MVFKDSILYSHGRENHMEMFTEGQARIWVREFIIECPVKDLIKLTVSERIKFVVELCSRHLTRIVNFYDQYRQQRAILEKKFPSRKEGRE